MKIEDIKPNPNNPRFINDASFAKLVKSIKEFPKMMNLRPIVVDKDGMVLGGNMRLNALKELGYEEIPDEWVKCADELTEKERERFIIADNRPFGQWDFDTLANCFDAPDLIDWGFEEWELGVEGTDEGGTSGETDPDSIPEKPEKPNSTRGKMIYLASPYTDKDTDVQEARFRAVCAHVAEMMRNGHHVFSPIAHTHPVAQFGLPSDWDFWQKYDTDMISRCDEVAVLCLDGWEKSKGVQAEIEIARNMGKTVTYIAIDGN